MITPQTNIDLDGIAKHLLTLDSFVICGHVSPDGDCIGSQLALYHALKVLGKDVVCVLAKSSSVDEDLLFLPGAKEMVPAAEYEGTFDAFISCDVPTVDRIGDGAALQSRSKVTFTIDHHATEQTMSDYTYVDPDAASTTMIIWSLIKKFAIEPNADMALCAYTGLVTDTGGFVFQNTDSAAFLAASEMVSTGIDPAKVASNVFQNRRRASLELEARALERMVVSPDGLFVMSYITRDDFEQTFGEKSDVDPIINVLRSLKGVRIACVLREQTDGVRGSIRAKDDTDVAAIARRFNGGGHKAAAGFTVYASIEKAFEQVWEALGEATQ